MTADWPTLHLPDAAATEHAGQQLARAIQALPPADTPVLITLDGPLGAGKTALVGATVRGLGHVGVVKSPTYTLVEPYDTRPPVLHMDLYRLEAPDAFLDLGVEDERGVWMVEWPVRATGVLPPADLCLTLDYRGTSRVLSGCAGSHRGTALMNHVTANLEGASS